MKHIEDIVYMIVKKYGTKCPFEICKLMGVNICAMDLPSSVKGLFVKTKGREYILLSKNLSEEDRVKTCAHELGHLVLHNNINCMSLPRNLSINMNNVEKEAELFGELLLKCEDIDDFEKVYYEIK